MGGQAARWVMVAASWLLIGCDLASAEGQAPSVQPRNVVLIVVDDLGLQLGCYGDRLARTPNLDRLAAEGTRFARAYCTTSSCSASRSVILTGQYNHATAHYGHAHAEHHFSTLDGVRSLPVMLARAGFATCSIGKLHLAPENVYRFDAYRNEATAGARNPVRMAENAEAWIRDQRDRRFFLYFCPADPHRGPGSGEDGFANHEDEGVYPGVQPSRFRPEDVEVPAWLPDNDATRKELSEFYQAAARLDQGIGRLLQALEATGHWDDTLVIFCSDNGPPFPGAKTTLYEPGVNLPLIVRKPGQQGGLVTDALVCWADLTPTILEGLGVALEPGIDRPRHSGEPKPPGDGAGRIPEARFHGRSFWPLLENPGAEGFDRIFLSHTFHEVTMYYPMRGIVDKRYKYIRNIAHPLPFPFASDLYRSATWQAMRTSGAPVYGRRPVASYLQRPPDELYDLREDPHEVRNLAGLAEYRERLEAMKGALRKWQQQTRDPWLVKWEYE
jgi:N-sulfoglucosamine sulfohydrolase